MRWLKITLAYDGTNYAGWQVQDNGVTVQSVFETAWQKITGEQQRATASGRTDSGVHALGQVVSICTESEMPPERIVGGLNASLPDDVVVLQVQPAPDGFHAISEAVRKRYRYLIWASRQRPIFLRNYTWHIHAKLDFAAMQTAAERLVGHHDFACFQATGSDRKTTERTILHAGFQVADASHNPFDSGLTAEQGRAAQQSVRVFVDEAPVATPLLVFEIEADGFLYKMVRNIVGSLVEIGAGRQQPDWIAELIAAKDRRAAGQTAPPHGLFLQHVTYEF